MEKTLKICSKGHKFYKSSDCPVCPVCEAERKPDSGFLADMSAPARRALENEGITSLDELSKWSEREILKLHGVGPSAMPRLKKALKASGLEFSQG